MHVYKLKLSMSLLFVNRNKKAMKTCGNCVDKEMNFAVKPLLFLMKGRKICRIIIIDDGNRQMQTLIYAHYIDENVYYSADVSTAFVELYFSGISLSNSLSASQVSLFG